MYLTNVLLLGAFIAVGEGAGYPYAVKDTTYLSLPSVFTGQFNPHPTTNGRNLALRPSGTSFQAVLDDSSPTFYGQLQNGTLQAMQLDPKTGEPKSLNLHGGVGKSYKYNKGKSTIYEIVFSNQTLPKQDFFQYVHDPGTTGNYVISINPGSPKSGQETFTSAALCKQGGGGGSEYYSLAFTVTINEQPVYPSGCFFANFWSVIPTDLKAKASSDGDNSGDSHVRYDRQSGAVVTSL